MLHGNATEPANYRIVFRYYTLYNNQMNARALIGQSAMVYCITKLMENVCSEL